MLGGFRTCVCKYIYYTFYVCVFIPRLGLQRGFYCGFALSQLLGSCLLLKLVRLLSLDIWVGSILPITLIICFDAPLANAKATLFQSPTPGGNRVAHSSSKTRSAVLTGLARSFITSAHSSSESLSSPSLYCWNSTGLTGCQTQASWCHLAGIPSVLCKRKDLPTKWWCRQAFTNHQLLQAFLFNPSWDIATSHGTQVGEPRCYVAFRTYANSLQ